ncbi:MAG: NAD(P)-binding domain-containing protein [Ancalomicrobiaceae bacterium]|nr:NAD(P)-binding domain-containing protein [Ancalomicrobiaceae bacterium]
MQTIGFIGAGRIARIMLEGWKRAGVLPPAVVVYDLDAAAAARLEAAYQPVSVGDLAEVAEADLVVVGLHPPVLADVLPQVAPHLRPQAIVLSLAPKLKFAALASLLGGFDRLARQNPNAPSIIDCGFNPIAFADALIDADRDMLIALMRPLGDCPVVDEAAIEAYALISAMGPTYLWFQLNELEHLAEEFGLTEAAARQAVAAMAHGAAATLLESDLAAADVMNLVPVKPLGADEQIIVAAYRDRLRPLYAKLTA